MPAASISFAKSALRDLEGIRGWYAGECVPEVGDRLLSETFERTETLADHPDIRRVAPEFAQAFLRELIHPPFRIVYRRGPAHFCHLTQRFTVFSMGYGFPMVMLATTFGTSRRWGR